MQAPVCADAGYRKYNATVTHGGGGELSCQGPLQAARGRGPLPAARLLGEASPTESHTHSTT